MMERVGLSVFREGERLARLAEVDRRQAAAELAEVRRLREELEAELERLRSLADELGRRVASLGWLAANRRRAASR